MTGAGQHLAMEAAAAALMAVHPARDSHRSALSFSKCATPASVTRGRASNLRSRRATRLPPICERAASESVAHAERLSSRKARRRAICATAASFRAGAPDRSRRTSSVWLHMAVTHEGSSCARPGSSRRRRGLEARERSVERSSHARDTRWATTRAATSAGSRAGAVELLAICSATDCTHSSSRLGGVRRPSAVRRAGVRGGMRVCPSTAGEVGGERGVPVPSAAVAAREHADPIGRPD